MLTNFNITQQGASHIKRNIAGQDYSNAKKIKLEDSEREYVIGAIADGVGSCMFSQFGSEVAVNSYIKCVEANLNDKNDKKEDLSDEKIYEILEHSFGYSLAMVDSEATKRELPFLEFDSTLTGFIYDGRNLWFGHIGDDGIVVMYTDGTYEMITNRHKGEEANSVIPLRERECWQFGKARKDVASFVAMTDGVLDYCVGREVMNNRVYFPFLEPALTSVMDSDEAACQHKADWSEYLAGEGEYEINFRQKVTDDITFAVVQNSELVKALPEISFDHIKWDNDTRLRIEQENKEMYADFYAYKEAKAKAKEEVKTKDEAKEKADAEIKEEIKEEAKEIKEKAKKIVMMLLDKKLRNNETCDVKKSANEDAIGSKAIEKSDNTEDE